MAPMLVINFSAVNRLRISLDNFPMLSSLASLDFFLRIRKLLFVTVLFVQSLRINLLDPLNYLHGSLLLHLIRVASILLDLR